MAKIKLISFALFFIIFVYFAQADHIPKPYSYVSDFAGIIEDSEENTINSLIAGIEENKSVEIAVVAVESLNGIPIEDFSIKLFDEWKIGKEKEDNGILILISKSDRQYRIDVGYGLEYILNDAKVGRLARDYLVPGIKENNFGKGIFDLVNEINNELAQETQKEPKNQIIFLGGMIVFSIFYFILMAFLHKYFVKIKNEKMQDATGIIHTVLLVITYFISIYLFILWIFITIMFASFILGSSHHKSNSAYHSGWGYGGFGRIGGSGGFGGFGGGSAGGGGASGRF